MSIKLGTPVRQIVPAAVAGVVVKKQFNEAEDKFEVLVEWGDTPERSAARAELDQQQATLNEALSAAEKAGDAPNAEILRAQLAALVPVEGPHSSWFWENEVEATDAQADGETQSITSSDVGSVAAVLGNTGA